MMMMMMTTVTMMMKMVVVMLVVVLIISPPYCLCTSADNDNKFCQNIDINVLKLCLLNNCTL